MHFYLLLIGMQVVMDAVNNDGNQQMQKMSNQMIYILIVMRAMFLRIFSMIQHTTLVLLILYVCVCI